MFGNKKQAPNLERLKELLEYSPSTGVFTWKQDVGARIKAGSIAGGSDANGYIRISFDKQIYPAHRLARFYVYGDWPSVISHLNGNKADNRIANLRVAIKDPVTGYKNTPDTTVGRVREILDYNPETGVFLWKIASSLRTPIGSVSGVVNNAGYRLISIDGKKYLAHRLAWLYVHGVWPKGDIDHINRDKLDNRLINLRQATRTENNVNSGLRSDNKSGYKGVTWHNGSQKWRAVVQKNGKQFQVGMFSDPKEAHEAYLKASRELHGNFADSSTINS